MNYYRIKPYGVSAYAVVNVQTSAIQSVWYDYSDAYDTCNRLIIAAVKVAAYKHRNNRPSNNRITSIHMIKS